MIILVTGGCGFIGSHTVEKFVNEGHKVVIIDNLSKGKREHITVEHKFYNLDIADKRCEEIFRLHNFDIVIHLAAQIDVNSSNEKSYDDTRTNILGLINMLELSAKYKIKRFIFASSAAVYGNTKLTPITENFSSRPFSVYGINKLNGEFYCRKWKQIYGLDTRIFRLSNVYGPRQSNDSEAGVVSIFINNVLDGKDILVFGDGSQTRDFIYVTDVANAFYLSAMAENNSKNVLNLSICKETSINDLIGLVSEIKKISNVIYTDSRDSDIYKSSLDNSSIKKELGWNEEYSIKEGIQKTFKWFEQEKQVHKATIYNVENRTGKMLWKRVKPYFENILIFVFLLVLVKFFPSNNSVNNTHSIDYNFIYIIVFGMIYGKSQSLLSVLFAIIIFLYNFLNLGGEIVTFIYDSRYFLHITFYLLIGVITGYSIDKKERIIEKNQSEKENLEKRYEFLEEMYLESNEIKDELHKQIIENDDSFGKIYSMVKELESLEKENIYNAALEVLEKIIKADKIAIYTINKTKDYLRLKVKSKHPKFNIPNSIKIDHFEELVNVVFDKKAFINKNLKVDLPIMVTPIVNESETIALVCVYDIDFEKLNLNRENLFIMSVNLVSGALNKAYLFEKSTYEKRYIPQTKILRHEEFTNIIEEIRKRETKYNFNHILLKIEKNNYSIQKINYILNKVIRSEDYISMGKDGDIYILLLNTDNETADLVIKRLEKNNFNTKKLGD